MRKFYLALIVLIAALWNSGCKKKSNPVYSYNFTYSGKLYTFNDITFTSVAPAGVTYLWNFGDGATSTDAVPVHTYTRSGSFDVKLTVNNDATHATHNTVSVTSTTGLMGGSYTRTKAGGVTQAEKWPIPFLTFYPIDPSILTFSVSVGNDSVINFTDSFSHTFHSTRPFVLDAAKTTPGKITFVLAGGNEFVTFAYNDTVAYYNIVTPASSGYSIEQYFLAR